MGGTCVQDTGYGRRSNISGAEEILVQLRRMRHDGGTIISKEAHGKPTQTMRPPDEGVNEKCEGPITYVVSFPRIIQLVRCPVPGCHVKAHIEGRLREHFTFRIFRSQIAVVQEVREPLPRCNMCGMYTPEGRFIKNLQIERCDKNTQMRWRRRDVEIAAK